MFCEKCGEKQEVDAKFCSKCGHNLNNNDIKKITFKDELKTKFANISKKNKIVMGSVLLITFIALITLGILLNNPVKKVEDSLARYYSSNKENNYKELINIGKVLKDNKNEEKVLHSIKNTVENITSQWVKNFNTEYKDIDTLKKSYTKVKNAIEDIYEYFSGLKYILDTKTYNEYMTELKTYYYSKESYFEALKYEEKDDLYKAYYFYQKVDEKDSYYKKSQEFISSYIQDEVENLRAKSNKIIKIDKNSSNEEYLKVYIEQLKYLNTHKITNNIDLSESVEYKKLFNDCLTNIIKTTKNIAEDLQKDTNYEKIVNIINDTINSIEDIVKEDDLKELFKLKEKYEDKLPLSLLKKERLSYYGVESSNYKKTINNKEYNNNLSFNTNIEKGIIVYNLNKEYKKLKTILIKEIDNINGDLIIYGDDLEIYKSSIDNKSEKEIDIEINVENIKELKIEFNNKTILSKDYIYLVEPYLYK